MATPINYRGEYNENETYHVLDVVYAGPNNVICVRANRGEDLNNPQYWAVIAKGEKAEAPAISINPANKHWIINGKDTGETAQGETGSDSYTNSIVSGQDLNSLDTNGTYAGILTKVSNSPWSDPSSMSFILEVKAFGNHVLQRATDLDSNEQWERTRSYSGWTDWRQTTKWS